MPILARYFPKTSPKKRRELAMSESNTGPSRQTSGWLLGVFSITPSYPSWSELAPHDFSNPRCATSRTGSPGPHAARSGDANICRVRAETRSAAHGRARFRLECDAQFDLRLVRPRPRRPRPSSARVPGSRTTDVGGTAAREAQGVWASCALAMGYGRRISQRLRATKAHRNALIGSAYRTPQASRTPVSSLEICSCDKGVGRKV